MGHVLERLTTPASSVELLFLPLARARLTALQRR
jgi:hypothetical protein